MNGAVEFLVALRQALAAMSLYASDHATRQNATVRLYETMRALLTERGVIRFTFLHGDAIVGPKVLTELRTADWSRKLSDAGVQRIEIDSVPPPGNADLQRFLQALHERLHSRDGASMPTIALPGFRAGMLATEDESADTPANAKTSTDVRIEPPVLVEEASAVRWIHDEMSTGKAIPLAEVEGVVHGLAAALHRDQHVLMPLLTLKSFDQYTTTHSCNVSMLSMGLAEQLGFAAADVRAVGTAALLHDIGKVHVPVEILVKPGKLTDEEMDIMRSHAVEGARMLGARGRGHALAAVVAYEHHIWTNGAGGYPGLRYSRRCHYASRVVHVCDLYDALCTRRPYRDAWPRERTLALLVDRSGIEVDREIVDAFIALSARTHESRTPLVEESHNDWNRKVERAAEEMATPAA